MAAAAVAILGDGTAVAVAGMDVAVVAAVDGGRWRMG